MEFWKPVFILLLSQAITLISGTACSPSNITAAPDNCTMAIRKAIVDVNRFWFGSSYAQRCSGPNAYTLDCVNMFPPAAGPRSIASVIFWQNTFEVSLIKHILEVKFTSLPGSYEGCGIFVSRNTTQAFRLDPLSDDAYQPWDTRAMPEVTWPTEANQLYSLIVIDVGFGFTHGIYLNIDGNNMSSATVLKEYSGPLNFRRLPNPYIFLLFEHTGRVNVGDQWMGIIKNPMLKFNVSDFQENHALKGPIAVNWLLSSYDAYSINKQSAWGVENCVSLIQDKATVYHSNRPWLKMTSPLTVNVKVNFEMNPIDFTMCCKDFRFPEKGFTLNPLGNTTVLPVETRSEQEVYLRLSMSGISTRNTTTSPFQGKHYTLVMVDPDVPSATAGTNERPLLHWLVINMAVDAKNIPRGTTIQPYGGPAPPDQKPHTYYYLLYQQHDNLTLQNAEDYDGQCSSSLVGRCLFDVNKFQQDLNLTLVGVSWMTAYNDYYTNYTKTTRGQEMDQFCQWTPDYKNPCPVQPTPIPAGGNSGGSGNAGNAARSRLASTALMIISGFLAAILRW